MPHTLYIALVLLVHLLLDLRGHRKDIAAHVLITLQAPVLIVAQRAVERRQLAQLCALVLVALLIHRPEQLAHHLCRLLRYLHRVRRNEHVQLLILAGVGLHVPPCRGAALLDAALAAQCDFGARLALHALLCVATRADNEPDEVVAREFLDRHGNLQDLLARLVVGRRAEARAQPHQVAQQVGALRQQLLLGPMLTRIGALAHAVVDGRRRPRALGRVRIDAQGAAQQVGLHAHQLRVRATHRLRRARWRLTRHGNHRHDQRPTAALDSPAACLLHVRHALGRFGRLRRHTTRRRSLPA